MTAEIVEISGDNYKIFVDKDLAEQVNKSWFQSDYWQSNNAIVGESSGRNTAYFIDYSNLKMVLRRYYRGGLMAKLSRDSYLFTGYSSARAYSEIYMLNAMIQRDLPVPKPLAAMVEKSALFWYKNAILIERIEDAIDGFHDLLVKPWRPDLWHKLGLMIKQFHLEGVYHSDMNIHNLLLDSNEKFWMIDFDKCRFRDHTSDWQQETINRLKRSLLKEKSKHAEFHFSEANWQALLDGYNSGD